MSGYTIHTAEASQAIEQLNQILEDLQAEIKSLKDAEDNLLSDANWQGPNKEEYKADFENYLSEVGKLLANGVEHLEALQGIATAYIKNEG